MPELTEQDLEAVLRSLEDLEIERASGELSDEDYQLLHDRYTAMAARTIKELSGGLGRAVETGDVSGSGATSVAKDRRARAKSPPKSARRPGSRVALDARARLGAPRRSRRRIFGALAAAAFGCAALILVATHVTRALPGQVLSGSLKLSPEQQMDRKLAQAAVLAGKGEDVRALQLYRQVLSTDPHEPAALAGTGWLEWQAGSEGGDPSLARAGEADLRESAKLDPKESEVHLLLGTVLFDQGHISLAVSQFKEFLADKPPAVLMSSGHQVIVEAFTAEHLSVPSQVLGSATSASGSGSAAAGLPSSAK